MPIDHALIEQSGWRQGAVFGAEASRVLLAPRLEEIAVDGFAIPTAARLILVSHTCDVVHRTSQEPRVEVMPAVPIRALEGNYRGARNPRRLHVNLGSGHNPFPCEVRGPTRFWIPRERLQESVPEIDMGLAGQELQQFTLWLAKRMSRVALPTEFDRRIHQRARDRLRRILAPLAGTVDRLLIAIDPDDQELPPEIPYSVQLVALLDATIAVHPDRMAAAEDAMTRVADVVRTCEGVNLDACIAESESRMTVEEFRQFATWDYDDLSIAAGERTPERFP